MFMGKSIVIDITPSKSRLERAQRVKGINLYRDIYGLYRLYEKKALASLRLRTGVTTVQFTMLNAVILSEGEDKTTITPRIKEAYGSIDDRRYRRTMKALVDLGYIELVRHQYRGQPRQYTHTGRATALVTSFTRDVNKLIRKGVH